MSKGMARARANIALAKYWGKSDLALNLPAVPSVSVTFPVNPVTVLPSAATALTVTAGAIEAFIATVVGC